MEGPPRDEAAGTAAPGGSRLPPHWLDAAVELLARTGTSGTLVVRGGSMEPTLGPGAVISVDFSPCRLRVGDLLVFRQAGFLVVHRLVRRRRDAGSPLRTQGDACPDPDPPVASDSVLGRVTAVQRSPGIWLSVDDGRAPSYARAIAAFLNVTAGVIRAASITDTLLRRVRLRPRLRDRLTGLQRRALRMAQRRLEPRFLRPASTAQPADPSRGDESGA